MANRRISELQELAGLDLADNDLLTVVDTGEVDPAIKNKKLTISGTKAYLSVFYLPRTGGTISGSINVQEDVVVGSGLTVSGDTLLNNLSVTNAVTFLNATVQGNLTVSGNISGNTITGNVGAFTTLNAVSGNFSAQVTGGTFTGTTFNGDTGRFQTLTA